MTSTPGFTVELFDGSGDLGDGVGALYGDLADRELHCRPTLSGILDHVALGRTGPAADQADGSGQEGQPALTIGVQQAFGGEDALEMLQPGEQLADTDRADVAGGERERAALLPELRLGLDDDPGTLGQRAGHPFQHADRHGHRQRHVDVGVAQRQIGGLGAGPTRELHDLALDPQGGHPPDVLRDLDADPHRPGVLGGGVAGALRKLAAGGRWLAHGRTLGRPAYHGCVTEPATARPNACCSRLRAATAPASTGP